MKEQLRTGITRLAIAVSLIPAALIWIGVGKMVAEYPDTHMHESVIVGLIGLAAVWLIRWVMLGFLPR